MAFGEDDGGSGILLAALGGVALFLILRPGEAGAITTGAAPAPTIGDTVRDWLASFTPALPGAAQAQSPAALAAQGITSPGAATVIVAPGAGVIATGSYPPVSTVTPVYVQPGLPTLPAAVAVGGAVAAAAMSDLDFAKLIADMSLSVVKAGGQVIQWTGLLGNITVVLQVIGTVGLVVDMAFTALSDKSDTQKAVDMALDAAMIVCLWIPVYGWIVAIVLALVKLLVDMFAFDDHKKDHAMHEAAERARYGELLAPMLADVATAYSPREMVRVLAGWYHGNHQVAMATGFYDVNGAGHTVVITDPADPAQPNTGIPGAPFSWDDLAYALVWTPSAKLWASAQVGIRTDLKAIFETAVLQGLEKKRGVWLPMMQEGATLDDLDVMADELRLTPDLDGLAAFYGQPDWKALIAPTLQAPWARYVAEHPNDGSVKAFARANGYADLRAWRAAILAPLWPAYLRWKRTLRALNDFIAWQRQREQQAAAGYSYGSVSAP